MEIMKRTFILAGLLFFSFGHPTHAEVQKKTHDQQVEDAISCLTTKIPGFAFKEDDGVIPKSREPSIVDILRTICTRPLENFVLSEEEMEALDADFFVDTLIRKEINEFNKSVVYRYPYPQKKS
jgi:hypothetical protein